MKLCKSAGGLLLGTHIGCRGFALGRVREVVGVRTDLLPGEEVVPVRIKGIVPEHVPRASMSEDLLYVSNDSKYKYM